ncbi:uncharacterized protein LOC136086792 [Hydra vulgaris]|uniref:Uncharacterized protein LOC136086792 n=1 Tax=Hydra vulgaris TaxID=6087 RepID=A0ABM4CTV1_HYDVU
MAIIAVEENTAFAEWFDEDEIKTKGLNIPNDAIISDELDCPIPIISIDNFCLNEAKVSWVEKSKFVINHPSLMTRKHNIAHCLYALCLWDMGKYNEALEIYHSVDEIRTKILGINHSDTMATKHNIAHCLYDMGKYNKTLEICYSVNKIDIKTLGNNHPNTMTTNCNIALCLNFVTSYHRHTVKRLSLDMRSRVFLVKTESSSLNRLVNLAEAGIENLEPKVLTYFQKHSIPTNVAGLYVAIINKGVSQNLYACKLVGQVWF